MASDDGTVLAEWVGPPAIITLPSGERVEANPGKTVCAIGKDEAESSDNWKPLTKKQAADHRAATSNDNEGDA